MKAEDEQDVKAASLLKAEQDAELAEFNESIPLDEDVSVSDYDTSCSAFSEFSHSIKPVFHLANLFARTEKEAT